MLNSCELIGKIVKMPYVVTDVKKVDHVLFDLELERPFRNSEGEYETDVVAVEFWNGEADRLIEKSELGDYVAIRGRISTIKEKGEEDGRLVLVVMAETVSYLTLRICSKKKQK
ncbi:MAG: single-stranded DNA-binding protein [Erysipelotrichales bacterium]|jgi:single-strand DNA-binding protein|nr:single-stranded DNA-binding protein [Erysipelotrichales bacterium]MBQ1386883.1 single-stranded DNA-binding protein [Erysipelotrichales bacterium]MBQ2309281.1 single-stranded DNA-binding protein [Erysipelotrichales bacterium]MBQ2477843.1 single-stranded DNA-binding protein [Erysipelotrichales bacterium]MBQ4375821.1 single-stranded DNA-binding protein [Erysipelotrichales bacterium]